ncbi:hypothetical protein AX774_g5009 [Zancudomyces culisetae]|uniref:Uncharacterized protein n=1 Tax=Zancudomyces culisetae TaxID=1213189 RepID=A0A1R1PKP9_ZANCU|nr:hypothetical protein AX774_g5009 [Zancudomyces culisetae]|eukprot:OMH81534.1 hypothetical protein AX774_g5009 [Zancudomyces culisetae]
MVIKNCQYLQSPDFLVHRVSKYYTETIQTVQRGSAEVHNLIAYLNQHVNYNPEPFPSFILDQYFVNDLNKWVDVLSYYSLFYYRQLDLVKTHRGDLKEEVRNVKAFINLITQKHSALFSQQFSKRDSSEDVRKKKAELLNYASNLFDTFQKITDILAGAREMLLAKSKNRPAETDGDEDRKGLVLQCIRSALANTNRLSPDNKEIERVSILKWYMSSIEAEQNSAYKKMISLKEQGDKAAFEESQEKYNKLKEFIEKKVKRVVLFTRNDYFDVVHIEIIAPNKVSVITRNNRAYMSQFSWALDSDPTEDPERIKELRNIIRNEFGILTEYGIAAEASAIFD